MWHLCVVSRSIHIRDDVNGGGGTQESAATDNHTVNILDTLTDSDSPINMSLIHALIARGTTVLAEHATGTAELKPGASSLPALSPTIPLMFLQLPR